MSSPGVNDMKLILRYFFAFLIPCVSMGPATGA